MRPENSMPSNVEAEEQLLASILGHTPRLLQVLDRLTPADFYRSSHSVLYAAIERVYSYGKPFNASSVLYDLKKHGELEDAGGEMAVRHFADSFFSTASIDTYLAEIKRTSNLRKAAQAAQTAFDKAFNQDDDTVETAVRAFTDILLGVDADSVASLEEIGIEYMRVLQERRENFIHQRANGIPTGFADLDHMLGGLQPSDMIVLAARPSLGKTALSLNIALNVVKRAKHVLFFSMEMSRLALYQRLMSMESPINQVFLRTGDLDDEQWRDLERANETLSGLDLRIDDRSRKLSDIRNKARREHARQPLSLIVVDYLQLVQASEQGRGKNENRAEEIATISRGLKGIAMELNVPILVLAQLNRAVESRQSKVPQLSDLAEGSAIEKDADVVGCIYTTDEQIARRNEGMPYNVVINVNKHRNGPVGEVVLKFRPRTTTFEDATKEGDEDA